VSSVQQLSSHNPGRVQIREQFELITSILLNWRSTIALLSAPILPIIYRARAQRCSFQPSDSGSPSCIDPSPSFIPSSSPQVHRV
jgi:hypothetical protein